MPASVPGRSPRDPDPVRGLGARPVRRALVTGASEGIGRALAFSLARDGYQVTVLARRKAVLQALARELGPGHAFLAADLGTRAGLGAAKRLLERGGWNLLVNNAGFGASGPFQDVPYGRLQAVLDVNISALTELAHAFLAQAGRGDALVNVSSGMAFLPTPNKAVYAASKAYVTSLSEALWCEQRKRGVYVLGLCPGVTRTNFSLRSSGRPLRAPGFMVQSPEQVAERTLRALRSRRSPTVWSGAVNRAYCFLSRLQPRSWTVRQMGAARG